MSLEARHSLLAAAACGALLVMTSSTPSPLARTAPAEAVASPPVPSGAAWLEATLTALDEPVQVRVPFAADGELGGAADVAMAYAFRARAGQTLEIGLRRESSVEEGPIYVEVFRVVDVLGERLRERLTALRPSASTMRTKLPSDGTYHVLVQTDAGGMSHYGLTLELDAALPFPVVGAEADAIRSLFGASRDAGRRNHAGVDIFVQRLTPVLAVAAGRAMPRHDELGGNTVWLNTPGTSYYYAHLDRVAVREEQRVKIGDVLGYVGNSGNAVGMPSHLHFGVYRWGREPIDPLPLLLGQRFEAEPALAAKSTGG